MAVRPRIGMVAAVADNGVIGRDNQLPWHLPADLAYFKKVTLGHPIIMGRQAHESIGRPLPGRHNIVLTRSRDYSAPGCTVAHSAEEALAAAGECEEVMVIGGEQIYRLFLPQADLLYLTQVHASPEGDTFFPGFDEAAWEPIFREDRPADERNPFPLTFLTLGRKQVLP